MDATEAKAPEAIRFRNASADYYLSSEGILKVTIFSDMFWTLFAAILVVSMGEWLFLLTSIPREYMPVNGVGPALILPVIMLVLLYQHTRNGREGRLMNRSFEELKNMKGARFTPMSGVFAIRSLRT